jgi:hypothetical protein
MTRAQSRTVANVMLVTAGAAAAYVVWTTPSLRRLAMQAARVWLGASVPVYLIDQTRRAWVESGRSA